MDDEAVLKEREDELAEYFQTKLDSERNYSKSFADFNDERFKSTVDESIERGAADFDETKEVAIRAIRNEKMFFIKRTRQLFKNIRCEFEHFMTQFTKVQNKKEIREKFVHGLVINHKKCLETVESALEQYQSRVRNYRSEEMYEVKERHHKHHNEAKLFFARDAGLQQDASPIHERKYLEIEKERTLSIEDYENIVIRTADHFNRMRQNTIAVLELLSAELEKFAIASIDDSLINGWAVFDVFTKIPTKAMQAVLSDILKVITDIRGNAKIRVKHLHGLCKSDVAPEHLFEDLTLPVETEHYRQCSENDLASDAKLHFYRKTERDQAIADFDAFKKLYSDSAIMRVFRMADFVDLSRYQLEEIGKGAQSTVYSLSMEIEGEVRKIAAKKYTRGSLAEIAVCKTKHINIASYLTAGILGNDTYLISEFYPKTLAGEIYENPTGLPKSDFIRYDADMAKGLDYLRLYDMHHGDLKPANILISEGGTLKLADFGISNIANRDDVKMYRRESDWSGTPQYMAPELIRGSSSDMFSERFEQCDVWSYAIVVWEMMARRRPYDGIEKPKLITVIGKDAKHPDLPPCSNLESLVNLLRKCWNSVNPSRPKFHQIIKELEEIRQDIEGMDDESWKKECAIWSAC